MSARAKIVWVGMIAGAVLFGSEAISLGNADDSTPSTAGLSANTNNPYSVIVERNVFRLNPPPPPPPISNAPPPDLPVISFGGITETANEVKAHLSVKVKTGNSTMSERISYLTMGEGDKEGVVEVIKIFPVEERVDINNSGTRMTLTMKENGYKNDPAPAPGGRGAGPGGPGVRQIGTPGTVQPGVPGLPGAAALTPSQAQIAGGGNNSSALILGSSRNGSGANTPTPNTGGTVNTVAQQQSGYQFNNYGTGGGLVTGGRSTPPVVTPPLTLPLGQNGDLSHLTQPNSTPNTATSQAAGIPTPPMPTAY
jgi:hypothetical protein